MVRGTCCGRSWVGDERSHCCVRTRGCGEVFDDVDLFDVVLPPISALAQDAQAIGREATRMLFDRIEGFDGPARHVEVPLRLIDRSTAQLTGV